MPAPRERIQEAFKELLAELDLNEIAMSDSIAELGYRFYRAGWIRGEAFSKRQQMDEERDAAAHRYTPPDARVLPTPARYHEDLAPRLPIAPATRTRERPPTPPPVTHVPMTIEATSEPSEPPVDPRMTIGEAEAARDPLHNTGHSVAPTGGRRRVEDLWPPAPGREGPHRE